MKVNVDCIWAIVGHTVTVKLHLHCFQFTNLRVNPDVDSVEV